MTLKRTIELLKEYLKMNNIIELTNVNKCRLDEIIIIILLKYY